MYWRATVQSPSSARSKPSRAFIQGEGQIDLSIVRSPCDQDQLVQTVVGDWYLCNQMNPVRHLVNPGNLGGCGQGPQDSSHRRHWYFLHSPVALFEDYSDRWLKITEEASLRGTKVEKVCYLHDTSAPHNKHEVQSRSQSQWPRSCPTPCGASLTYN